MSGHGGFKIGRRTEQRVLLETSGNSDGIAASPAVSGAHLPAGGITEAEPTIGPTTASSDAGTQSRPAPRMKGFRHFLSDQPRTTASLSADKIPSDRWRELMARLARRMDVEINWQNHSPEAKKRYPNLESWENPEIPSGYTYLLQLVAHDLVASSFPISILEETLTGARNTRSSALRLDTIYGGGPAVCPAAYVPDDKKDTVRTALRLGSMKGPPGRCPILRDIPRMATPGAAWPHDPLPEVAIPDPRNDDNPILAQLVVLFHLLHGVVLKILKDKKLAHNEEEAYIERFLCARGAVTLIYRNVVANDLMKRVLHDAVYEFYYSKKAPGFAFLDGEAGTLDGDPRIPMEFSHAAFRFGHAMVRPNYRFNDRPDGEFGLQRVLMQTSAKLPTEMPLDAKWILRWSHFFEIGNSQPNLSRRIGPAFSPQFLGDAFYPLDEQKKAGLAYRDLLVGGFLSLWPVHPLIQMIKDRRRDLIAKSAVLSGLDEEGRNYRDRLRAFLEKERDQSGFQETKGDITALVDNPPLAFFVLWEAAEESKGMKLGVLGSIIVAEVIFAAMSRDPVTDRDSEGLRQSLATLSEQTYGKNNHYLDGELATIDSMEKLIKFVAIKAELQNAEPAFI